MEIEKRKHKRLTNHGVDAKFKFEKGAKHFDVRLMDISGGGTCFELDLEAEEKIEFSVFKPIFFDLRLEDKVIECKGHVVRVFTKVVDDRTLYELGLEFKDMPEEDIKFISDYVHKNIK